MEASTEAGEAAPEAGAVEPPTGPIVGMWGKCLAVVGGDNPPDGTQVTLEECDGTSGQQWTVMPNGRLVGASGKCLSADGVSPDAGSAIVVRACGQGNETWAFDPDTHWIHGVKGFCVNVLGGSPTNGTPVILFTCNGHVSDQWMLPARPVAMPVRMIIVRRDDGTGVTYSPDDLTAAIDRANDVFTRASLRFVYSAKRLSEERSSLLYDHLRPGAARQAEAETAADAVAARFPGELVLFEVDAGNLAYAPSVLGKLDFAVAGTTADWTLVAQALGSRLGLSPTSAMPPGADVAAFLRAASGVPSSVDEDLHRGVGAVIWDTPPDPGPDAWTQAGRNPCDTGPLVVGFSTFDPDRWNVMAPQTPCLGLLNRHLSPDQIALLRNTSIKPISRQDATVAAGQVAHLAAELDYFGQPRVFAATKSGTVAVRTRQGDQQDQWSPWEAFLPSPPAGSVAAWPLSDGTTMMFMLSGAAIYSLAERATHGDWWEPRPFVPDGVYTDLDMAVLPDGRRFLATVRDGAVVSYSDASIVPYHGWIGPTAIAGDTATQVALANDADGQLYLLELSGGHLVIRRNASGSWSSQNDGGTDATDVAAGHDASGAVQAFVVKDQRVLVRAVNDTSGTWTEISPLDGFDGELAATNLPDGSLVLFGLRSSSVWKAELHGGVWTAWAPF